MRGREGTGCWRWQFTCLMLLTMSTSFCAVGRHSVLGDESPVSLDSVVLQKVMLTLRERRYCTEPAVQARL